MNRHLCATVQKTVAISHAVARSLKDSTFCSFNLNTSGSPESPAQWVKFMMYLCILELLDAQFLYYDTAVTKTSIKNVQKPDLLVCCIEHNLNSKHWETKLVSTV